MRVKEQLAEGLKMFWRLALTLAVIAFTGLQVMTGYFFYNTHFGAIAFLKQQEQQNIQAIVNMGKDLHALKDSKVDDILVRYKVLELTQQQPNK